MERVSNNYDMLYVGVSNNLINTISDCKELSLSSSDINGPMKSFDNRFVERVDVRYRCGNLILNTSIRHNNR